MSPIARRRPVAAALASFGVVLASLAAVSVAAPAQANPAGTGLVISEVYGAGGNSGALYNADFVELYNPTNADIPLTGMHIHYRSGGGGSGGTPVALTGTVASHANYLIRMSATGANGAALPTPDLAPGSFAMAAAGGQVYLLSQSTAIATTGNQAGASGVIDMVGAVGATSFETAATSAGATTTLSLNRNGSGADTDNNTADFTTAAPSPTAGAPAALDATNPGNKTGTVGQASTGFSMAATGGASPYTWTDPGTTLPAGITVAANGAVSGTPTLAGPASVTLTVTDSLLATDTVSFTYTINAAPVGVTPIKDIQGTGDVSPMDGQVVNTEGVVTAAYPTGGLNGFYIQTPGADTVTASDAIFVYGGPGGFANYPAIGASVDVTGTVSEFSGQTQITATNSGVTPHGSALGTVTPKTQIPGTECALPGTACLSGATLDAAREVAEGEAFQPSGTYTATDVYDGSPFVPGVNFTPSMFGEIGLAANSDQPLVTPTEVIDAQATAAKNDRIAYNNAHRIVLDDGSTTSYLAGTNSSSALPLVHPEPRTAGRCRGDLPRSGSAHLQLWCLEDRAHDAGRGRAVRHPAAVRADPGRRGGAR